jgi:hypothetical protein
MRFSAKMDFRLRKKSILPQKPATGCFASHHVRDGA